MAYTGKVFEKQEQEVALVNVSEVGDYLIVRVTVGGQLAIQFPLPLDTDSNAIVTRTQTIVNQTGLVSNPVRVELTPVE